MIQILTFSLQPSYTKEPKKKKIIYNKKKYTTMVKIVKTFLALILI